DRVRGRREVDDIVADSVEVDDLVERNRERLIVGDRLYLSEERGTKCRVLLGVRAVQELQRTRIRRSSHRMRGIQEYPKLERGVEHDARRIYDEEVVLVALLDPPRDRRGAAFNVDLEFHADLRPLLGDRSSQRLGVVRG